LERRSEMADAESGASKFVVALLLELYDC
jgi:hypothetical protein